MNTSISIMTHLESIFRNIKQIVTAGDVGSTGKTERNAKGDSVKWFDLAADEAASSSPELHAVLVQQLKGDTVCT